jgi:hypothetical protein
MTIEAKEIRGKGNAYYTSYAHYKEAGKVTVHHIILD